MGDYAIIAGLNRYRDFDDLEGAVEDADQFHTWLTDPNGGGMRSDRDTIIQVPVPSSWDSNDPRPNSHELNAVLSDLHGQAAMADAPIGSRLFIFLAGHGFNDSGDMDNVALYTSEARMLVPNHLAARWYASEFRRIHAFDQIALIMDCCRTQNLMHPVVRPQAANIPPRTGANQVKFFVAYSTGFGLAARETETNGRKSGIFTQTLLQALRSAPPNRLGRLTGSIVKNFIHNQMPEVQSAEINADTNKEFVFIENHQTAGSPTEFEIQNYQGTETLRITDSQFKVVYEESPPNSPIVIPLIPGLHKAEIAGTNREKLVEIPSHEAIRI